MRRSTARRQRQHMEQIARRASRTVADQARPETGGTGGNAAGDNDPTTGEWQAYGQLGLTTFGDGFRLKG